MRRYALTGERFGAEEAVRIGLAHKVVPLAELAAAGEQMVAQLLENGPVAMAETKQIALQSAWGGFSRATFEALVAEPRRQAPLARRPPKASPRSPRSARRSGSDSSSRNSRAANIRDASTIADHAVLGPGYSPAANSGMTAGYSAGCMAPAQPAAARPAWCRSAGG